MKYAEIFAEFSSATHALACGQVGIVLVANRSVVLSHVVTENIKSGYIVLWCQYCIIEGNV